MASSEPPDGEPLATLTHARLRAEQGDLAEACRILDRLLRLDPLHEEARRLRDELGRRGRPAGAAAAREERRARIRRLERWLARLSHRGAAKR